MAENEVEIEFLRSQVAKHKEDLVELDLLRNQVAEKEEEIQRCRFEVQRLVKTDKAAAGLGSGDASSAIATNPRVEFPKETFVTVKQRQNPLRNARNEPPVKQTSNVSEPGVLSRCRWRCQDLWALAQTERVRPLMLVCTLVGVFAVVWVMFFMSWGGQRRFIAGVQ